MKLVDGPILPNDCDLFNAGYDYFLTQKWGFGCTDEIIEKFSSALRRVMTCNELVEVECFTETDDCVRIITVTGDTESFVYPNNNATCRTIIGPPGVEIDKRSYIRTPQTNVDPCQS